MAIDIYPCPFCGSHHLHIVNHLFTHGVACESCKSQGPRCRRVEEAVVEWNQTSKQIQEAQVMRKHFLQGARLAAYHMKKDKAAVQKEH